MPTGELDNPPTWLYVSRRLDLLLVPNEPPWAVPVFTYGPSDKPTAFYRLTAAVLVWLEAAGEQLQRAFTAGAVGREAIDDFVNHMLPVWEWAQRHIDVQAVKMARAAGGVELPEPPVPK